MAEKTGIAWTDHTFNPWWGCLKVSPGCEHCYAETFSKRTGHDIWGPAKTTSRRRFPAKHWLEPMKWNDAAEKDGQRRRVFCASMADVFEDHPQVIGAREELWALVRLTPWLDWQILTKRPENVAAMLPSDWGPDGYDNVWLGVSAEDQKRADERIPILANLPAQTRFVSCEPLIGLIRSNDLWQWDELDWVIVGGESGGERRPMDLEWFEVIVRSCLALEVAVFTKQDNAFKPDQRGRIPDELWVREFPKTIHTLSDHAPSEERPTPHPESR